MPVSTHVHSTLVTWLKTFSVEKHPGWIFLVRTSKSRWVSLRAVAVLNTRPNWWGITSLPTRQHLCFKNKTINQHHWCSQFIFIFTKMNCTFVVLNWPGKAGSPHTVSFGNWDIYVHGKNLMRFKHLIWYTAKFLILSKLQNNKPCHSSSGLDKLHI